MGSLMLSQTITFGKHEGARMKGTGFWVVPSNPNTLKLAKAIGDYLEHGAKDELVPLVEVRSFIFEVLNTILRC